MHVYESTLHLSEYLCTYMCAYVRMFVAMFNIMNVNIHLFTSIYMYNQVVTYI